MSSPAAPAGRLSQRRAEKEASAAAHVLSSPASPESIKGKGWQYEVFLCFTTGSSKLFF